MSFKTQLLFLFSVRIQQRKYLAAAHKEIHKEGEDVIAMYPKTKPGETSQQKAPSPQTSRPASQAGTPKTSRPPSAQAEKPPTPKAASPAGSKAPSPAGSKAGSKAASPAGSKAGSKAASPAGSKPATPAGSRPTSARSDAGGKVSRRSSAASVKSQKVKKYLVI